MRTIVIVPLLMLAFILVGKSAHAENVLYCQSELATGFAEQDGKWTVVEFVPERWTLKFNDDFTLLTGLHPKFQYFCDRRAKISEPELIICRMSPNGSTSFMFDKESLRFVYAMLSVYAYTNDGSSPYKARTYTDKLYAGTCEQF